MDNFRQEVHGNGLFLSAPENDAGILFRLYVGSGFRCYLPCEILKYLEHRGF